MATTRTKFIRKCDEIVAAKPKYVKGASSKTECDCIGMIKYGLRECGVTGFSTLGTNYTFRLQVKNIRKITGPESLREGDVVFKVKKPGDEGYDLKTRYKPGGKLYNGDLNDYCHIGVVKSVNPIRIIHMTGPTAKTDTSIGKWAWAAELDEKYVSDGKAASGGSGAGTGDGSSGSGAGSGSSGAGSGATEGAAMLSATVIAQKGKTVNLRARPSKGAAILERVPVGTVLTVSSYKADWCCVRNGKRTGYMMTEFLSFS